MFQATPSLQAWRVGSNHACPVIMYDDDPESAHLLWIAEDSETEDSAPAGTLLADPVHENPASSLGVRQRSASEAPEEEQPASNRVKRWYGREGALAHIFRSRYPSGSLRDDDSDPPPPRCLSYEAYLRRVTPHNLAFLFPDICECLKIIAESNASQENPAPSPSDTNPAEDSEGVDGSFATVLDLPDGATAIGSSLTGSEFSSLEIEEWLFHRMIVFISALSPQNTLLDTLQQPSANASSSPSVKASLPIDPPPDLLPNPQAPFPVLDCVSCNLSKAEPSLACTTPARLTLPPTWTRAAVATRCAGLCPRDYPRIYLGIEILGHACKGADSRPYSPQITLDEPASKVATRLLTLMGLDPETTTPDDADASNCRFICLHDECGTVEEPTVRDFRGAIFHSVIQHGYADSRIEIATEGDTKRARNLEMRNTRGIYHGKEWGCAHCSAHLRGLDAWFSQQRVVSHIRETHRIEDPKEQIDYFYNHRTFRAPCIVDLEIFAGPPIESGFVDYTGFLITSFAQKARDYIFSFKA